MGLAVIRFHMGHVLMPRRAGDRDHIRGRRLQWQQESQYQDEEPSHDAHFIGSLTPQEFARAQKITNYRRPDGYAATAKVATHA